MADASLARASIAACPACESQLLLPDEAAAGREVRCPACDAGFTVDATLVTRLPVATLLPLSEEAAEPLAGSPPPEKRPAAPEQELAPGVFGDSGFEGLPAWSPPSFADSEPQEPQPQPATEEPAAEEPPLVVAGSDSEDQPEETPTPTLADWLTPKAEQESAEVPSVAASTEDNATEGDSERSSEMLSLLDQLRGLSPTDAAPAENSPTQPSNTPPVDKLTKEPVANLVMNEAPGVTLDLSTPPLPDFAMPTEPTSAEPAPESEPTPAMSPRLAEPLHLATEDEGFDSVSGGSSWKLGRTIAVTAGALAGVGLGYGLLLLVGGPAYDTLGLLRSDMPSPPAPAVPDDADPGSRFVADAQQATFESPGDAMEGESPADELTPPAPFAAEATPLTPPLEEPQALEPPPVSEPATAGIGIAGAPVYSAEELSQALAGADQARADLAAHCLADETNLELVGRSYAKLCEVAQVMSFLDDDRSHPNMLINRLEAQDLYSRLLRYAHAREDSRQVATRWLNWPDRPHGGVFFSGIPVDAAKVGSVYEYRFELADGEPVAVLTEKPIRVARFDGAMSIGIVGCVIESPAERIDGYTGSAPRAVWVAHTIPLGNPEFE